MPHNVLTSTLHHTMDTQQLYPIMENFQSCPSVRDSIDYAAMQGSYNQSIAAPSIEGTQLSASHRFGESIAWTLGLTAAAVAYSEAIYQGTKILYFKGILRRYHPLPTERDYLSNYINGCSFIGPCALLYFFYLDPSLADPEAARIDWSFNPLIFTLHLALYMIGHDAYFSEVHRHSHVNKFIYRVLHQMHHEYTHDMNGFAVGYAEAVENFLQVGVPWMTWTLFASPNVWNWLLPLSLTLFTTIVGHSCYQMHYSIAAFHPLIVPIQLLVGQHMLTPGDHQVHHSHRRFNYGLFFRYCDKYHGTYRKCDVKAKDVHYWSKRFQEEDKKAVAHGKLDKDMKTRKAMQYEEEGGLHWGW